MNCKKDMSDRLKRGLVLSAVCAVVAFLILFILHDNLTIGVAMAAPAVILVYFILGRFF